MKNLITYLKALWSWVSGSQRKKIGVTLGEATIEHPFSTYSAPFGTCWQPSGKLHSVVRCAAMLVMLFTIGSGNVWGKDVTFTAGTDDTSDGKEGVTIVISSGDDSGNPYKIYASATAIFTAPSGYNITKIVFTSTNKGTEKYSLNGFGTGAPATWSYDPSANVYTGTWTGSTSSVTFTASSAQVRLTNIVVTIAASTTYSVTWKSDGVTVHTDAAVPSGTTVSTPSDPSVPSGCTGAKFMGWTATENYSHATDAPVDLFNGTSPTINSAKTYYAVFADPN